MNRRQANRTHTAYSTELAIAEEALEVFRVKYGDAWVDRPEARELLQAYNRACDWEIATRGLGEAATRRSEEPERNPRIGILGRILPWLWLYGHLGCFVRYWPPAAEVISDQSAVSSGGGRWGC